MTLLTVQPAFQFNPGPAVATKLDAFAKLSTDDRAALAKISQNVRFIDPRRDLISEGDKPR